jgi:two-component system sensor histidine kinase BarA
MKEPLSWRNDSDREMSASAAFMKREIEIPHLSVMLHKGILQADGAQADFVKAMTHELRTPLNVIIGLCQLLERDRNTPLSPNQKDAVDRMERNARSLLESVNRLLGCVRRGEFK